MTEEAVCNQPDLCGTTMMLSRKVKPDVNHVNSTKRDGPHIGCMDVSPQTMLSLSTTLARAS